MLRSIGLLAGTAVVGLVALKIIGLVLLPLLGLVFGFVMFALKLALIAGLIYFGYRLFSNWGKERGSEAS